MRRGFIFAISETIKAFNSIYNLKAWFRPALRNVQVRIFGECAARSRKRGDRCSDRVQRKSRALPLNVLTAELGGKNNVTKIGPYYLMQTRRRRMEWISKQFTKLAVSVFGVDMVILLEVYYSHSPCFSVVSQVLCLLELRL